jgi:hypothetical protein
MNLGVQFSLKDEIDHLSKRAEMIETTKVIWRFSWLSRVKVSKKIFL